MTKLIILATLFFEASFAEAIGFSNGSEFTATPVQGQVQVTCFDQSRATFAQYTCRDVVLDPHPYDYFKGPYEPRGNTVKLTAKREDGSIRVKAGEYDGYRAQSEDPFNLWISTIFQKPLLNIGVNSIHFDIFADSNFAEKIAEGDFAVRISRGAPRTCPQGSYNSTDPTDCNSPYTVCQRYFLEHRNCR